MTFEQIWNSKHFIEDIKIPVKPPKPMLQGL